MSRFGEPLFTTRVARLMQTTRHEGIIMGRYDSTTCWCRLTVTTIFLHGIVLIAGTSGDEFVANYDEAKVPDYRLPDPLQTSSGRQVTTAEQWRQTRQGELLELFRRHVYGRSPQPTAVQGVVVSQTDQALDGKAVRREIDITVGEGSDAITLQMLVYTPRGITTPVPAFLGLNFQGNHTVDDDPAIRIPTTWVRERNDGTTDNHRATEAGRGTAASRWQAEKIIGRGYGLATIYYGDIDPDFDDNFANGIHRQFAAWSANIDRGERWGSIAGWAYGLSRALDYLTTDPHIDGTRVAVMGFSRLGKTSLWAGATDERFKLVISNNSGCGGAALSMRAYGETIGQINHAFPHWFCDNYTKFNEKERDLPVDQHELLALIAPRAVYVASAVEDRWADPKGEFLSTFHADRVFRLLGTNGLGGTSPPADQPHVDDPLKSGRIGYHVRSGKHDVTAFDWEQYLDFADQHL